MREKVDLIVKSRFIITMSEPMVIEDGAIAVSEGRIVAVGRSGRMLSEYTAEEVIQRDRHIVMPGLIDTHTHTQQVLLRSSIGDYELSLPPIWTRYLIPFENRLDDDLAYLSSLLSLINMVRMGTTYFIEAGAPRPGELVRAVNEVGIKGVVTASTFDLINGERLDTKGVLNRTLELIGVARGNARPWCSIRQLMMASEDLILGLRDLCLRHGLGITYHLDEYQGEVDYSLTRYGVRPLEALDRLGITSVRPSVIAHGVYMSASEVEIMRRKGLGLAWCPTVDSILMGPHWLAFNHRDLIFGIGSDGGAFTSLDLLHEVKVARALGKSSLVSHTYDKSSLDSLTLLRALTGFGGALVNDRVGAIREGFSADFIVLDARSTASIPIYDPINAVVSILEGSSVSDVVVNGGFIMMNGRLLTVSEERVLELLDRNLDKVFGIINELRESIKSG
ncbi:amidohydrolase family protein [Vulcanisaeta thermophila]|uniref:amidohydrolase family protein n=1 Tax=Vulcanisaeta thermophila TaxID=867917 RepID=UPI0008538509|nr:amidohydrolase family protein [Vulcanisaeta thermophila]